MGDTARRKRRQEHWALAHVFGVPNEEVTSPGPAPFLASNAESPTQNTKPRSVLSFQIIRSNTKGD